MSRLTEYHCGVAVIKNKELLKEAMAKLAHYEDLADDGKLLELPCGVGDTVYLVEGSCESLGGNFDCEWNCLECDCFKVKIEEVSFCYGVINDLNKTVFLTREEAEKALEEMKGKA